MTPLCDSPEVGIRTHAILVLDGDESKVADCTVLYVYSSIQQWD